jgi:hypothetical protein
MKMKKYSALVIFLYVTAMLGALEISVTDPEHAPLPAAGVAIFELGLEDYTNTEGVVVFPHVGPGEYTVIVVLPGFQKLERRLTLKSGNEKITLTLSRPVLEVEETTISEKRDKGRVQSRTTIRTGDMEKSTQNVMNDAASTLKTLPGVSSSGDTFDANMYIQGGSQDEWVACLDGVYITNPYRWGGRVSMFNPTFISSLDLYTAGYPALFDQGLAGILDVTVKEGNSSSWEGFADMAAASAEITASGPISDSGTLYVNARRTWYDLLMPLIMQKEDMEGVQFPYLWDGVCKLSFNLTPRDSLYLLAYVSYEGMNMNMDSEVTGAGSPEEGKFHYEQFKALAGIRYLHAFNDKDYMESILAVLPHLGRGNFSGSSTEGNDFDFAGGNAEAFQYFHINSLAGHRLTLGAGVLTGLFEGEFSSWYYAFDPDQNWVKIENGVKYDSFVPQFGMVNVMDDWEIFPHLILELGAVANGYLNTGEANILPRGGIKYEITPELDVFARGGMYNLYPFDFSYLDKNYGNPDLQSSKAIHAISGLEFSNQDYMFLAEGFYKYYYDLPMRDTVLNYNNNGIRHAAGFDVYLQKKARENDWVSGWISYTFVYAREMVTARSAETTGQEPYSQPVGKWYTPSFAGEHTLSVVLELTYRENTVTPILNWLAGCKLSFDFRLLSGKPYTPATGVDIVNIGGTDRYLFHYGGYNSEEMPLIMKLDIKLTMPGSLFSLFNLFGANIKSSSYISFINVLNNNNVYQYYYDVDQNDNLVRKEVKDYPFMILGGMRVEF